MHVSNKSAQLNCVLMQSLVFWVFLVYRVTEPRPKMLLSALQLKDEGNELLKKGNCAEAERKYSLAILASIHMPGPGSGDEELQSVCVSSLPAVLFHPPSLSSPFTLCLSPFCLLGLEVLGPTQFKAL